MPRWSPTDVAHARQQYADLVSRVQSSAAKATPQMATNIVNDHKQYPWLDANVVAYLNSEGASDLVKRTAAYASARAGMVSAQTFLEQPDPSVAAAGSELANIAAGALARAPRKRGFWEKTFHPLNWLGEKAGAAVGSHVRAAGKGVVRGVTTALAAPYQATQNVIGKGLINPVANTIGDVAHGRWSELPGDIAKQAVHGAAAALGPAGLDATTWRRGSDGRPFESGAVMATDAAQSILHPDKMGSGFFAGKGVQDLTADEAKRVRGTDPGGHAWTIGRFVAAPLPQDSGWHKALSGTVDIASAITLDPLNIIGGGAAGHVAEGGGLVGRAGKLLNGPVGNRIAEAVAAGRAERIAEGGAMLARANEARKAASQWDDAAQAVRLLGEGEASASDLAGAANAVSSAQAWAAHADELTKAAEDTLGVTAAFEKAAARNPEWASKVRASAGLIDSPKGGSVMEQRSLKWLLSKEGQKTVEVLRNVDSAETIRALYKGKISVKGMHNLAEATTSEDVVRVLAEELGAGLRSPNPLKNARTLAMQQSVTDRFPTVARAMGMVPKGTWMDFAKPEEALTALYDTLGNAKITGPERTAIFNEWAKAFATEDVGAFYELGKKTNAKLAEQLVANGMAKEDALDITTAFFKDSETMRAYASEDLTKLVPGTFLDGDIHSPIRVSQILDGGWGLMDPGELNRVRIQTGRVKYLLGEEGSARRLPITAVNWFQDRVFKPLAVTRPALFLRLLPDEAMRIMFGGHISDGAGFFYAIANHPKTSAMGEMFDAPGELLKIDRSINKITGGEKALSRAADRASELLKQGDVAGLIAEHPQHTDFLADVGRQHGDLLRLEAKVVAGDSLTAAEAQQLEDLADIHGGGSALDALHTELGNLEGRVARKVTDHPELADLYERRSVLERQFSRRQQGIIEVLTGQRGDGTIARRFNGVTNDTALYKSGSRVIIQKSDQRYAQMYKSGLVDELMSMTSDPVYRRIANGGLLPGDVIHDEVGHVGGVVDEYTLRRQEIADQLADVDRRMAEHEDNAARLRAAHDEQLAPHLAKRDELYQARDAGRARVAEREQVASEIRKARDQAAAGVDIQAGQAAKARLDEATQRLEAAKANVDNEVSGFEDLKRKAVKDEWNPRRSTQRNLEAQKAVKDEWDAKIARAKANGERRIARQQATVDRLTGEYDATGHARVARLDRRVTEAERDLSVTRRLEAKAAREDGLVEHRKVLADVRKGHKGELKASEVARTQLERERALIERRAAKVDAALKKGLLGGNGRTYLGDTPSDLDEVKRWLLNGNGREFTEKYARATGRTVDEKFVSDWVDLMSADVASTWGSNAEARQAIATGKLRGESVREATRQWGPKPIPSETLTSWADEFAASADAPRQIRYEPSLEEARRHGLTTTEKIAEQRRKVFDRAFAYFYGNASDRFIRIPEYAGSYWSSMEELIPKLAPDEAGRLLDNLELAELPKAQEARIRTLVRGAHGDGLLEDADQLAHGWALDDVKKLLFDMERRGQFQDMTRTLAPFGRAWWEVISTWGRIGMESPGTAAQLAHSVDKGMKAARGAGVFYRDENNQEVFNYPLSGPLAKMFASVMAPGSAGQVETMFRAKVAGLSIGTQVLPGIGPVVALPTYELMKHLPVPSGIEKVVFPFGKPESIEGAALPAWAEKLRSGFNADEHEQIYANTLFEVARGLANSGMYGTDAVSLERMMGDAKKQATGLTVLRGIMQAFGPSAPIPTYSAHTGDFDPKTGKYTGPDVTVMRLAQEYQKLIADPKKVAELGAKTPAEALLMEFGPGVAYYIYGKTQTVSGGETASEQFGRWQESNKDLAGRYPLVFGYFGPQTQGYSQTVAQRQIEMGTRKVRTPNDMLALANAKLADIIYYGAKDQIMASNRQQGVNKLDENQRAWLADRRAKLEQQFPGWDIEARSAESRARNQRQIAQLSAAVRDRKVTDTPTGRALAQYMQWRSAVIDEATRAGITGWGQANATQPLRDWLQAKASELALNDAGFAAMYDDVLSREMKD